MPIHLLVLQTESAACDVDVKAMKAHGVLVDFVDPKKLSTVTKVTDEVVLISDGSNDDTLLWISQLQSMAPNCKLIVQTGKSFNRACACLQAGVRGILDTCHDTNQLAEIVKQIDVNRYYLDMHIAQLLAIRHIKKLLEPFTELSSREFDVFCLLAEGCSLQTIANQLGISSKTVSNCQTQIKTKLGLTSREALVNFAQKHGLSA